MKFVISFLFIGSTYASPIRILHERNSERAFMVKEIFLEKYNIPEDLISIIPTLDCEKVTGRGKFDLCLKTNGDLQVVSVDRGFVEESLKIFQAP